MPVYFAKREKLGNLKNIDLDLNDFLIFVKYDMDQLYDKLVHLNSFHGILTRTIYFIFYNKHSN